MQISPTAYIEKQVNTIANTKTMGVGFGAIFDTVQKNSTKQKAKATQARVKAAESARATMAALKKIAINKDDYKAIQEKLEKAGVSKEALNRLQDQAEDNDLTWDGLFGILEQAAKLESAPKAMSISPDAENKISSFLQQVGLDPSQSRDILADIKDGNTDNAWKAISEAIKKAAPNAELAITKEELHALGKGLQLDNNTLAKLESLILSADSKMGSSELKQLTALLDSSINAQNASGEKLLEEIKQQLNPLIAKALENSDKVSSGIHATNEENAAKILRADQATEKGLGFAHSVNSKGDAQGQPTSAEANNKSTAITATAVVGAANSESADANGNSLQSGNHNHSGSPWMNFFNNGSMAVNTAATGQVDSTAPNFFSQSIATRHASNSIIEQIQNGVFRSLRNGVSQLSLKLNASDFGPVSVLVSTKSGEVAASIHAENPEIAKALHENMHTLRTSLESQGLKVDKLEIQTGSQQNLSHQGWNSTDQHNAQQQAHQRFLAKQQLRQLKNTKQDLINGNTLLQQARQSHSKLYLVA